MVRLGAVRVKSSVRSTRSEDRWSVATIKKLMGIGGGSAVGTGKRRTHGSMVRIPRASGSEAQFDCDLLANG
jgi:hypothetical protein